MPRNIILFLKQIEALPLGSLLDIDLRSERDDYRSVVLHNLDHFVKRIVLLRIELRLQWVEGNILEVSAHAKSL